MFGKALEELGLIHVLTGEHLDLHELSKEEFAMALARAGIRHAHRGNGKPWSQCIFLLETRTHTHF